MLAVYRNQKNKLCYLIYDESREIMRLITDTTEFEITEVKNMNLCAYILIANDFKEFVSLDVEQFVIDQEEADYIDERCNCSHRFIDELNRFGFNLTYNVEDILWRTK